GKTIEETLAIKSFSVYRFEQGYHFQRRLSAFYAFISDWFFTATDFLTDYAGTGSLDRLVNGIAGQHAEQDRNPVPQVRFHDADAHGRIDVLIVCRFATDDGPQA